MLQLLLCGALLVAGAAVTRQTDGNDALERFLHGPDVQLTSYRAVRTLHASTRGGTMQARLVAETSESPESGFQYSIVDESGSDTVRSRVLRAALEAEREMKTGGDTAGGALDAQNYTFTPGLAGHDGLLAVAISPRRRDDTRLVEGVVWLTPTDGDLVRVEGRLVKRPSFWTRRVEVVRRYTRIDGVRVPVLMESVADVLIVGRSTFSMAWAYEEINGRPVE